MREFWGNIAGVLAGNTVLNYLADTCVTVSVVIVFLLLIRPLMKKLPRMGMYVLWFTVILRMLCPVTINGIYGMLPEKVEKSVAQTSEWVKVETLASRYKDSVKTEQGEIHDNYGIAPENKPESVETVMDSTDNETPASTGFWERFKKIDADTYILFVWGSGVGVCWLYMLCSLIKVKRKYSDAKHLFDNVYTHPLAGSSFVGGLFSPKIYMPEDMRMEDREYILCHERVHIKRRDYLIKPFAFAVLSLMWFNPLIWVAWHFMMKDMEISCDEMVMKELGEEARKQYSYLLLSMASGQSGDFSQNPAFSVGVIRERIVNVMGYKKPTLFVTIFAVLAVALCSCGIASAPEEETEEPVVIEERRFYIEQALDWYPEKLYGENDITDYSYPTVNNDGNMGTLITFYDSEYGGDYELKQVELIEEDWCEKEFSWQKEYKEMFEGKNAYIESHQYAEDGYLYLLVCEYPMSLAKFASDREKYEKNMYVKDFCLLRVDEKAGSITEVNIPKESGEEAAKKIYDGDVPDDLNAKGMQLEEIVVFPDGNLYISNYNGNICGIYSGVTGEKLADLDDKLGMWKGRMGSVRTGDDFLCFLYVDPDTKEVLINVYGEDGEFQYSLPTGEKYDYLVAAEEREEPRIALGVSESTIMMATQKGIFEAELGEEEFTQTVDAQKDYLYYLPSDYKMGNNMYKDGKGDYYVVLYKDKISAMEYHLCQYHEEVH